MVKFYRLILRKENFNLASKKLIINSSSSMQLLLFIQIVISIVSSEGMNRWSRHLPLYLPLGQNEISFITS